MSPLLEGLRAYLALLTITAMVPFLLLNNVRKHNTTMIFLDVLLSLAILFVWIVMAQEAVKWLRTKRAAPGPQGPG